MLFLFIFFHKNSTQEKLLAGKIQFVECKWLCVCVRACETIPFLRWKSNRSKKKTREDYSETKNIYTTTTMFVQNFVKIPFAVFGWKENAHRKEIPPRNHFSGGWAAIFCGPITDTDTLLFNSSFCSKKKHPKTQLKIDLTFWSSGKNHKSSNIINCVYLCVRVKCIGVKVLKSNLKSRHRNRKL